MIKICYPGNTVLQVTFYLLSLPGSPSLYIAFCSLYLSPTVGFGVPLPFPSLPSLPPKKK